MFEEAPFFVSDFVFWECIVGVLEDIVFDKEEIHVYDQNGNFLRIETDFMPLKGLFIGKLYKFFIKETEGKKFCYFWCILNINFNLYKKMYSLKKDFLILLEKEESL